MGSLEALKYIRSKVVSAGTLAGSRVYLSIVPQDATFPVVLLDIISRAESPTQDSGSAVDEYRVQVDCMAKTTSSQSAAEQAHTLAEAVRAALSREAYQTTGAGGEYQYSFQSLQEANHITEYISDYDVYRVQNDYMIRVVTPI